MRYINTIFKSITDFLKDGGLMLAGAVSYFAMMAIVPFCLLLVTIFGYFLGGNEEFLRFFTSKLIGFFPKVTHEITDEIRKIISYKGIGQFSAILYLFLSYQLFSCLEASLNIIFKVKAKRHFIISLFLSFFIITLIIIFTVASFGATAAISVLKALQDFFPIIRVGPITGFLIKYIVPLVFIFLTVVTLYTFLPRKRVHIISALRGALFTAILLEIAKHLFTIYILKIVKLGTIYGPLSAFIIFLLWVYYSSCIFLIGAEIVNNLQTSNNRQK